MYEVPDIPQEMNTGLTCEYEWDELFDSRHGCGELLVERYAHLKTGENETVMISVLICPVCDGGAVN